VESRHKAWPVTQYVTSLAGLEEFARSYAGERMLCYGINPRPAVLTRPDGRLRSARDDDIAACQNLVLDFDLDDAITAGRLEELKRFLARADEYVLGLGLRKPIRAATGRGSHLLFAFPQIPTCEYPDLGERWRCFRDDLYNAMRPELDAIGARLDRTQDLRRVVRCYGTAKPGVGYASRFYGRARCEDARLRERLLSLFPRAVLATPAACPPLTITDNLPTWFTDLLNCDDRLQQLWRGVGKPAGMDQSSTGYDFTIARYLIRHGHNDPDELGTILTLRPDASVRRHSKGSAYVARTIQNALATTTHREGEGAA
jgi:hypothetical protein